MLAEFEKYLLNDFPDIKSRKLFLAVSGGKDSMVLSYLLRQLELEHTLLHCNFQLRGKEADEDEQFLLTYAKTYDLPIEIQRFDTYKIAEEKNQSIQETARNLRYSWFEKFAENARILILTAHHLDDSIETFFINLLRGTGIKGIKGIPKFNPPYYRPLLQFTANDIFNFIDAQGIDYREDSTNAETKYLRNRIRHSLLPTLLELEPEFKLKMNAFFQEILEVNAYLENSSDLAHEELIDSNEHGQFLKINTLKNLHHIIIQFSLSNYGIKRSNMNAFLDFIESTSGAIFKTDSHIFTKDRELIRISQESAKTEDFEAKISNFPCSINVGTNTLLFDIVNSSELNYDDNPLQLDFDKLQLPLKLRNWRRGDKITPLGMSGKKLISDVLIDNKVPQFRKQETIVVEDSSGTIVGIPGLLINEFFKSDQLTKKLLQITLS